MAFLVDERYQLIAQFLQEYLVSSGGTEQTGAYAKAVNDTGFQDQIDALGGQGTFESLFQVYDIGTLLGQPGYGASLDVFTLNYLVSNGEVSKAEAEAFLSQKYPGQAWSGGSWADFSLPDAEQSVIDEESSTAPGDPDTPTLDQKATTIQNAAGIGTSAHQLPITAPSFDDLPDEYDPDAIMQVVEDVFTQSFLNDQALNRGAIQFQHGSLDGALIAPGSLPPTAMQPIAWSKLLSQLPGPKQAILLNTSEAQNVDRWIGGTGPGRVRTVTSTTPPPDWAPYRGVHRYRIVDAGARLTVMSLSLDSTTWSGSNPSIVRPTWGFVIHNIPHWLGRPPAGIFALEYVGDAPIPFPYEFIDGGRPAAWAGADRLFNNRTKAVFQDVAKTWATPINTNAVLDPTVAELADFNGISAMLITGRTAEEVYEQMNTKVPIAGGGIRQSGHGPTESVPMGLTPSAPTVSSALKLSGGQFHHLDEDTDHSTEASFVQGVPFSYEDCDRLSPTNTHFSMVVAGHANIAHAAAGTHPSPALWHQHGLQLLSADDRVVQIDALIF